MNTNNTVSKKIRKALILVIPFLLSPGLNGCFLDDIEKLSSAFRPYMNTLAEKANNPQNQQLFQAAADQGEAKWQAETKAKLAGEQAAPTTVARADGAF